MHPLLTTLAVGATLASCATTPSGYNRIGRTDVCVLADLPNEEGGLGTVIPFFSAAQTGTVTVPRKVIDAQSDLVLTVYYSMRTQLKPLEGASLDKDLGLYKIEDGQERRFSDSIESPAFRYICMRSITDGIERCDRFANLGQWTYGTSFVDAKNWKGHEASLKKIFAQKIIQLCNQK